MCAVAKLLSVQMNTGPLYKLQFGEKKAARPFPNLVNVNAYQTGMRIAPDPNSTQSILQSLNTHTHSPKKKERKAFQFANIQNESLQ